MVDYKPAGIVHTQEDYAALLNSYAEAVKARDNALARTEKSEGRVKELEGLVGNLKEVVEVRGFEVLKKDIEHALEPAGMVGNKGGRQNIILFANEPLLREFGRWGYKENDIVGCYYPDLIEGDNRIIVDYFRGKEEGEQLIRIEEAETEEEEAKRKEKKLVKRERRSHLRRIKFVNYTRRFGDQASYTTFRLYHPNLFERLVTPEGRDELLRMLNEADRRAGQEKAKAEQKKHDRKFDKKLGNSIRKAEEGRR